MARLSYLIRRGGAYSACMRVPSDLVGKLGRRELVKALGANDPEEAKRRVMNVVQAWQRYFDTLRNRSPMTEEDKIDLVVAHYFSTLERDGQKRSTIATNAEIDAAMEHAVERV